jgi:sugar phosphate isomerase/epimerase
MDLPKCAAFNGARLKGPLADLSAAGLAISDLGASAQMHEPDPAKRAMHMDEARRFIDLAHELRAPYVRVFPNQFIPGVDKRVTFAHISDGLHQLAEYAGPAGVTIIVDLTASFVERRTSSQFWKVPNRRSSASSGTRSRQGLRERLSK